jgi:hypothetical protein
MIIYGYRERPVDVATGEFHCPRCQVHRAFKHKRMVRYFTLFFIPLFPLGRLGEYVECQTCLTTHNADVLNSSATSIRPVLPNYTRRGWLLALLGAGMFLCGGLFGLLMIIGQWTGEAGPNDNLQGFIGLFLLCPTPIMALGLAGLVGGFLTLAKHRQIMDGG